MACCRPLAALLLAALAPGSAFAQTTPAPMPDPLMSPDLQRLAPSAPTLAALVSQSAWQDPVVAAARAQFRQLPESCAAAAFKPTGALTVFSPAQFDTRGQLTAGVWSERVTETGCGAPRQLNVLTVLQPGSAPSRFATLPGDTHADPQTQKNALEYAQAIAIRAAPPGCKQMIFINTQFDGFTGLPDTTVRDGRETRAWVEDWFLAACGSTYSIQLTFKPNPQGLQLVGSNPVKRS